MKESMFDRHDELIRSVKEIGSQQSVFDRVERCCIQCNFWCGKCTLGKWNRIAWSKACDDFTVGKSPYVMLPLIMQKVKA